VFRIEEIVGLMWDEGAVHSQGETVLLWAIDRQEPVGLGSCLVAPIFGEFCPWERYELWFLGMDKKERLGW